MADLITNLVNKLAQKAKVGESPQITLRASTHESYPFDWHIDQQNGDGHYSSYYYKIDGIRQHITYHYFNPTDKYVFATALKGPSTLFAVEAHTHRD